MPFMTSVVACGTAVLVLGSSGLAHAESRCTGFGSLADASPIALGTIGDGSPRTHFIRDGSDVKGCPDATEACRDKAFVVPGNRVILSQSQGAFVCADYIGAKGADRAGWLPASAVTRQTQGPVARADWTGTWTREEAEITLKAVAKTGELSVQGNASWGSMDPDRVKRGAVNVGEIEARVTPAGAALSFALGAKATVPVDKGDSTDCKVWMRRLGPYLLVDDNFQCGGMNVSFRGVYTSKSHSAAKP